MCIYIIVDLQEEDPCLIPCKWEHCVPFWLGNKCSITFEASCTNWTQRTSHFKHCDTEITDTLSASLADRERTDGTYYTYYLLIRVCATEPNCEGGTFKHAQSTVTILKQPPSHFAHLTRGPCASQLAYCQSAGVILHELSVTKQRRVLVPGSA